MMKRIFFILIVPIVLYSCGKTDNPVVNNCVSTGGVPTAAEIAEVKTYLTSKGLTATQDSSGLFYNIVSLGYGQDYPFVTSNVTVKYKGSLKDGTIFDSTIAGQISGPFNLSSVVSGWTIGIPKIKKGGVIDLYIPPSLGYGCNIQEKIPQNSMLIFRVELVFF